MEQIKNRESNKKRLIVIGGATAVGKTAASILVAQSLGADIISADSRQFYREMSIGTAKPTPEERRAVPHHFIDSLSVTDDYSVGDFERDALALLDRLFSRCDDVVMTGGSGLFIEAVCKGLDHFPEVSPEVKAQVAEGEQTGGLVWLQQELSRLDPGYFAQVDQQNPARLRRALEVCLQSGVAYSSFLQKEKPARPFTPVYALLERPRAELYRRIDARVDAMIAEGLEAEARALLPYRDRACLRTVGYEEMFDYFDGRISRDEAIDKIKQHTRNYAKRQATWFRKRGEWQVFNADSAAAEIVRWLQTG